MLRYHLEISPPNSPDKLNAWESTYLCKWFDKMAHSSWNFVKLRASEALDLIGIGLEVSDRLKPGRLTFWQIVWRWAFLLVSIW